MLGTAFSLGIHAASVGMGILGSHFAWLALPAVIGGAGGILLHYQHYLPKRDVVRLVIGEFAGSAVFSGIFFGIGWFAQTAWLWL